MVVQVPSNSVADVQLLYKPDSYQTREEGRVCISSQAAGSYEYVCYGQVRLLAAEKSKLCFGPGLSSVSADTL